MSDKILLFSFEDIDSIDWPSSYDDSLIKEFFLAMIKQGSSKFIKNGFTKLALLKLENKIVPLTINETDYANSYVTSIHSYLSYAKEELKRHKKKVLFFMLKPLLWFISFWFKRASINRVISVNNFLLSTNLYEPLDQDEIVKIHKYLTGRFPAHTIIFRSLNNRTEKDLGVVLKKLSYDLITTRSIYFFDPEAYHSIPQKNRWINRRDQKLLLKEKFSILKQSNLTIEDIPRIKQLYDMLYLEKYSYLNPQFTLDFFKLALESKCFTLHGIKYQDELVGVIGYFIQNGVMTTPIVGYDTTKPNNLGLYRMLTALVIQDSLRSKTLFHMSSGVGHFKRDRGAVQQIEFMAVYTKHLSFFRQLPYKFLKILFNRVAKPIMIRNKL